MDMFIDMCIEIFVVKWTYNLSSVPDQGSGFTIVRSVLGMGCMQENGTCEGQSSACGRRRSAARDARAGFDCKATRITRAGMWWHTSNLPKMGSWWARRHEKGRAQGRRVATEAHRVGATRRDGHAEDECMVRVL